jgi:hypothetical protein
MKIDAETAAESLWQSLDWELPKALDVDAVFDEIASHLRRNPRFRDLSIAELDLALGDAKRAFQFRIVNLDWAIVRNFKDQIGFDDGDEAAA